MIFQIRRTSDWTDKEEPIDGAIKLNGETGGIQKWTIEINTLEELMHLIKRAKSRIVLEPGQIEIYDDYRE